jgi:phosphoribosylanthranilate isomerase
MATLSEPRRGWPPARRGVAVKICGLSSAVGVRAAVADGAQFVGFVFYPPSPRAVSPEAAGRLCAAVPPRVERVGMFVDADDATIASVLAAAPIDILQFHGRESPERVTAARKRFGRRIIKAMAIAGAADLRSATGYEEAADFLLFDAKPPRPDGLPGGNGVPFDWALLGGRSWRLPWLLSGGLTAEVLPQAVRVSGARTVDVSSGVESRPGVKNVEKIRRFLAAARAL